MATLDFYKSLTSGGLSGVTSGSSLPGSFIGPVRPGQTIGGVSPLGQRTPTSQGVLGASTGGGGAAQASGLSDVISEQERAAQEAAAAELSRLNSEYDYNKEQLQGQLSSLGGQRQNTLSSLETQLQGVRNQVGSSRTRAQESTDTSIQDALTTANDVQRKSRNTLRALGILNSSAAGELLQRPLSQYDTQRARLTQALNTRLSELDDFLNQKTSEHANAVRAIEQQYTDLVGRIQTDLRFNDRQRADAVKAANAALTQRLSEIKQAQFNYQSQVNALKNSYAQGLSQVNSYEQPTADLNSILSSAYTGQQVEQRPQQVGVYGTDEERKKNALNVDATSNNFLSSIA